MKNNIMTFNDVLTYPSHYISEIVQENPNPILLYIYGLFIAWEYSDEIRSKIEPMHIKNDVFRYMYEMTRIVKYSESKNTAADIKNEILFIIKGQSFKPYRYSSNVCTFGYAFINNIRKIQKDEKIMESAMLNYSPIVPYMQTIVKPQMETINIKQEKSLYSYEKLDRKIDRSLINDIPCLIKYHEMIFNLDELVETQNISTQDIIPSSVIAIFGIPDNEVILYHIMVYLRYVINEENLEDTILSLDEIYHTYRSTHDGEMIDLKKALEAFGKLSIPKDCMIS